MASLIKKHYVLSKQYHLGKLDGKYSLLGQLSILKGSKRGSNCAKTLNFDNFSTEILQIRCNLKKTLQRLISYIPGWCTLNNSHYRDNSMLLGAQKGGQIGQK